MGRLLTRLVFVPFVVVLFVWFSPVPDASAAGDVRVEFRGDPIPIHLEDLGPPDIPDSSYKLDGNWATRSGYSLRAVLEAAARSAGFQMISVVSVEIDADQGTRSIARSQLDNGPPIFFGEDGGTSWILPGSGGGDARLFAFRDSVPVIRVEYGVEFQVDLAATPARLRAGGEVQFRARVTGQQPGERLTYEWDFGDGKVADGTGGRIPHRFTSRGSYAVNLEVTGPSGGGSAQATVQVGEAKPPGKVKDPGGDREKDKGAKGEAGTNGNGNGTGDGSGTGRENGSGTGNGTGTGTGPGSGAGSVDGSQSTPGAAGSNPDGRASSGAPKQRFEKDGPERPAADREDRQLVRGLLIDPADLTRGPTPVPINQESDSGGSEKESSGIGQAALSITGVLVLLVLGGSTERLLFRRA